MTFYVGLTLLVSALVTNSQVQLGHSHVSGPGTQDMGVNITLYLYFGPQLSMHYALCKLYSSQKSSIRITKSSDTLVSAALASPRPF